MHITITGYDSSDGIYQSQQDDLGFCCLQSVTGANCKRRFPAKLPD